LIVLFRVDGSAEIGTGHVIRSLALAEALQARGAEVLFACAELTPALEARVREAGVPVRRLGPQIALGTPEDLAATVDLIREADAEWVVMDGYSFESPYEEGLREAARVLAVDDAASRPDYHADVVVNQNLTAAPRMYPGRAPHTRLLLGPRYALMRSAFADRRAPAPVVRADARRVVVSLGGADAGNVTTAVIHALRSLEPDRVEVVVLVGGSTPHLTAIRSAAGGAVEIVHDTRDVAGWMAWADVAVAAGGMTSFELAAMGVPSLLFVLADNQRQVAGNFADAGAAALLGEPEHVTPELIADEVRALLRDPERRRAMSLAGRRLVDGLGSSRVAEAMAVERG
jgi:UDP-2,4-diacetamido-2,4,6-trideoxy-beta-L-altropyranose hydrolase